MAHETGRIEYILNTGPNDIRMVPGKEDPFGPYCVEVRVEPSFIAAEGLSAALGLPKAGIAMEHVASTNKFTHLYLETSGNSSGGAVRLGEALHRLENYLNEDDPKAVDEYRHSSWSQRGQEK